MTNVILRSLSLWSPALLVGMVALLPQPRLLAAEAATTAHAAVAQDATLARLETWIESKVPGYMAEARLPGFSIAVVENGKTVYAEGFGAREPERNLPATADTLYGVGSITKSFVAIGIMQLVEQGKLRLDAPVSRHVPFELGRPGKPITIHHLLTHSLGLPSLATSTVALYRGLGVETGVPLSSAGDFYRMVNGAQDELVADPGERFFYHNAAWRILGHIIQVKSGMPFHEYLKTKIIDPLGMKRTTLNLADFRADPDHIVLHTKDADRNAVKVPFPYPDPADNPGFSFLSAAGGIVSSVNEMSRYLNAQLARGAHDSGRLASEGSFETMHTLHIRREDGFYGEHGYGYGLAVTPDFLGHEMLSHGGSIIASTAYMAWLPELKVGVIMMGNGSGMSYAPIAESVLAILMGQEPSKVVPALRVRERMDRLVGAYETYKGLERLQVVKRGGMLYLQSKNRLTGLARAAPLVPEDTLLDSTRFYTWSNGSKSPIEFRVSDEGGTVDLIVGRYRYRQWR